MQGPTRHPGLDPTTSAGRSSGGRRGPRCVRRRARGPFGGV